VRPTPICDDARRFEIALTLPSVDGVTPTAERRVATAGRSAATVGIAVRERLPTPPLLNATLGGDVMTMDEVFVSSKSEHKVDPSRGVDSFHREESSGDGRAGGTDVTRMCASAGVEEFVIAPQTLPAVLDRHARLPTETTDGGD